MIEALIRAATDYLEGPTGILARALQPQSWTLYLPAFPAYEMRLPLSPLISVSEISYVDPGGSEIVVDLGDYQILDGARSAIVPAHGNVWPSSRCQPRAVSVTFEVGYASIPPAIKSALLLMVGDLYANREAGGGAAEIKMSSTVTLLLAPFIARSIR